MKGEESGQMVAIGEGTLGLNLPEGDGKHPRVRQCFICQPWTIDKDMQPIEVPDQGAGWIEKRACKKCLDSLKGEDHGKITNPF